MPLLLDQITSKSERGERLTPEEGLALLSEPDLLEVGEAAQRVRFQKIPAHRVTYVVDSNPNYSNVCVADCLFCAFYRKPGDPEGYTLSVEQVMERMEPAVSRGATTLLLQGGLHPDLSLDYYLDLVRETRRRFPGVTPHFFTATEILQMAEVSGLPPEGVLEKLWEAGQRTLPGGGAEVLSERVRRRIAPKKNREDGWIRVHRAAHRIGFKSTATMMYGHVETKEDRMEHLTRIRDLQDETGGFTAFIPWSFKPSHTALEAKIQQNAGPSAFLRMIAVSRLYLDNFAHIQASWFSEGKKTGQVALHFGADDFGGTLFDEEVHQAAGHVNRTTVPEIQALIREAGFAPVQRTTLYEILRVFDAEPAAVVS